MTAAELEEAVNQRTRGWAPERRAAVFAQIRHQLLRSSPGVLAKALDPRTVQTPALQLIDDALADVDAGRTRRLMISLPPQEGKSTRVARYGVLWSLMRNPNRRVAIASYSDSLAGDHSGYVRDLIEAFGADAPAEGGTDLLSLRLSKTSHATHRWDLAGHRGGVVGVGIGSGLTGKPVDWMVIDDPFKDPQDAQSLTRRNRVWDWYTDVVLARGPKAIVVIMTRWHEDDLVGRLLEEDRALPEHLRQWRSLTISAQCDDPASDPLGRQLGEFLESARDGADGTEIHDEAFFLERKRNARTWASLYQGHPTPTEGGMFKWDWIRPYRIPADQVPHLPRVVVAVDTTGGGHDEAGIIGAGRDASRRFIVLTDRSGNYTAGGQWRTAWLTVLDLEADVLVYESNLVDPVMRKAIPAAWRRMREQAQALADSGLAEVDLDDVDDDVLDERLAAVARTLARSGDDDVMSADDPHAALAGQLRQLLPYVRRVLASPDVGPARVEGVRATRGKTTRAEPVSQAYETGQASHAGVFPALEQELVTWQEGQDSPNRLDALVWAWTHLAVAAAPARVRSAAGRARVGKGTAAAGSRTTATRR